MTFWRHEYHLSIPSDIQANGAFILINNYNDWNLCCFMMILSLIHETLHRLDWSQLHWHLDAGAGCLHVQMCFGRCPHGVLLVIICKPRDAWSSARSRGMEPSLAVPSQLFNPSGSTLHNREGNGAIEQNELIIWIKIGWKHLTKGHFTLQKTLGSFCLLTHF